MAPSKTKRSHSSSESEDEMPTRKMMKIVYPTSSSPVQKSLSPADSVTSPNACEKRTDESSESPSTPRRRRRRRITEGSSEHVNSVDLQMILQTNFTKLKEQMESTELSEKLQERGILDYEAVVNIQKGKSREMRTDILMKTLCCQGNRENVDFGAFLSALKESGQDKLARELENCTDINTILPEIPSIEWRKLLNFTLRMREILLEEVEPRRFLDKIVVTGGISFKEHEEISKLPKRRQRIQVLLDKIRLAQYSTAVKIIRPMTEIYSDFYNAFKDDKKGKAIKQKKIVLQQEDLVTVGAPLQIKLQITPITNSSVQDRNEHDDPATLFKKKKQEVEEIEKRIVANVNVNQEPLEELLETCITELKQIKFCCVKIYMKSLSRESFGKLLAYMRSGAAKTLLLSLIDEETKRKLVDMKAKVVVELFKGCECTVEAVPFQTECLCHLDKEIITRNFTSLMKGMRGSRSIVSRVLETLLLGDKAKKLLKEIQKIKQVEERNERLLQLLLQTNMPKVVFCILEDEIIKHGGKDIIRGVIEDDSAETTEKLSIVLTKSDIKNNKALLREELEPRWFIHRLEKKKDRATENLLNSVLESQSRTERIDYLLEYLLKENDFAWFSEELKTKHKHLLNTLMSRRTSRKYTMFDKLEMPRVEIATRLHVDDIIEEVDPLVFSERLTERTQKELNFSQLKVVRERSRRATQFCISLLGASQSIFCEVLHAMTVCGYKEVVEDITTLAKEGPLNNRYKCAKVQHLLEGCKHTRVFEKEFSLDENCSCVMTTVSEKFYDVKEENPGYETVDTASPKLRKSLKAESESGIFSGSGVFTEDTNTDEDSVHEDRSSTVDKRRMTKEWIESLSKSVAVTVVAPIEEERTKLQEEQKQQRQTTLFAPL